MGLWECVKKLLQRKKRSCKQILYGNGKYCTVVFFVLFSRWMTMKPFEKICKNEELEGNYWRRYSNNFCTLASNGCDEKGECSKVLV